jgi:hypothetical protein
LLCIALCVVVVPSLSAAQELRLPNKPGSLKFAITGDSASAEVVQNAIAKQLTNWRTAFRSSSC